MSVLLSNATADAKHVSIRMAEVHLADAPGHVSGRTGDLQASGNALLVDLVYVPYPNRHPDPLVGGLIAIVLEGGRVCAAASASLRSLTKEDLALAGLNRAKGRRRSPVPKFLPAPFLEPREGRGDIGDIEDRCQTLCVHEGEDITVDFDFSHSPLPHPVATNATRTEHPRM
jgi:hypothetical protein